MDRESRVKLPLARRSHKMRDSLDRLDIRVVKELLESLAIELDSIKETVESLEQSSEAVDTKLNDISSSLEILLQNAEME